MQTPRVKNDGNVSVPIKHVDTKPRGPGDGEVPACPSDGGDLHVCGVIWLLYELSLESATVQVRVLKIVYLGSLRTPFALAFLATMTVLYLVRTQRFTFLTPFPR